MTIIRDAEAVRSQPAESSNLHHLTVSAVVVSSAALAACGGGGSNTTNINVDKSSGTPASDPSASVATLLPEEDAARFLAQAGLSATPASVAKLVSKKLDYDGWLDEQFAMAPAQGLWSLAMNYEFDKVPKMIDSDAGMDNLLWFRLFSAPDELRQRVTLALSEIFVVSARNMPVPWGQFNCLAYWDVLEQNCFGTFRNLIEAITLSPAMGVYLSMRGSQKAGGKTGTDIGRRPDENYARELLQLFTIGLLHLDDAGQPTIRKGLRETYTNDDVTQLAKVLTGWDFDGKATFVPPVSTAYTNKPMKADDAAHDDKTEKTVLGQKIKSGQDAKTDLKQALDIICAHPNVAPFIARQLIQRLVSSNPELDHVRRVAAVFNSSGGDMKAVIRAVLTDPLARLPLTGDQAVRRCKLREPLMRFIQWGRVVGLRSTFTPDMIAASQIAHAADDKVRVLTILDWWNIGDLSASTRLAQSPLRSPSVFNFFRPGYVPLNSGVSADGFVAPEFQITDESSVIGYANFMRQHLDGAPDQFITVDYSPWLFLAPDATKLVDNINLLLTGRALAQTTVHVIRDAVNSLDATSADGNQTALLNRVKMAFYLLLVSADYMVQR